MTTSEILTYFLISAKIKSHIHMDKPDFYKLEMFFAEKRIFLEYYQSGDEVTFIDGHTSYKGEGAGTMFFCKLYGFAHLMKETGIDLEKA